ncbi:hypothetical protein [Candidatus Methanodesulfokora washburnensis]|uniref:hypothetical protein n=1 Tax=Candidatus Methanodesulfokora washburnensis TaxID=2478471 RepID=UPI001386E73A|nr:hypothetical protein [Candidatus Methanodesulfokores washburnensis]
MVATGFYLEKRGGVITGERSVYQAYMRAGAALKNPLKMEWFYKNTVEKPDQWIPKIY